MKILVGQPIFEIGISQLKKDIESNINVDMILYPEGYLDSEESLHEACLLSKKYSTRIVSSLRKNKKDIAVSINPNGEIEYFREKTSANFSTSLNLPLIYKTEKLKIGYLLCMEILKGVRDFSTETNIDFIVHPIGVGMFSEEQFEEWTNEAKKIAIRNKCYILGTSHSDGSYQNCGFSIPLAYCFDKNGDEVFLLKNEPVSKVIQIDLL